MKRGAEPRFFCACGRQTLTLDQLRHARPVSPHQCWRCGKRVPVVIGPAFRRQTAALITAASASANTTSPENDRNAIQERELLPVGRGLGAGWPVESRTALDPGAEQSGAAGGGATNRRRDRPEAGNSAVDGGENAES